MAVLLCYGEVLEGASERVKFRYVDASAKDMATKKANGAQPDAAGKNMATKEANGAQPDAAGKVMATKSRNINLPDARSGLINKVRRRGVVMREDADALYKSISTI